MASSNYFSGPNHGAQVGVNHGTINYMYTHEMLVESHGLHKREMNAFDVLFDHTKFPPFHHFVGRDWELAEIRKHLHPVNRIVILQGISGIGKSQIALAYAIKHARKPRAVDRTAVTPENEYGAIFWLDASSERRLMSSFLGIASRICDNHHSSTHLQEIVEEGDAAAAVDAVKRWLSLNMNDRWLLVYDGYNIQEDAFGLQPRNFDLRAFLPQVPQGDIIVTTNNPDVELTGQLIRVQSLTDIHQCVKILSLVSQRPTAMQDPEAYKLAEELGGMPCALDSAGRYLSSNESSISYKDYLKLYREEWQQSQTFIGAPKRPAFITWEIALAQIRQENEEAFELAISWVFFDHQDLWRDLLLPVPGLRKFIDFTELEDVHSFNEVMRTLCRYGFVEIGPDLSIHAQNSRGYSMHKYVHSWMTSVLYDKESQVSAELPNSLDFLRDMALYSLSAASKGPADCFRFLPHADRCLYLISKGFMEPSEDDTLFYQRTINLLSSYYLYASEWVSSAYGSPDSNNINFRKPRVSYWRSVSLQRFVALQYANHLDNIGVPHPERLLLAKTEKLCQISLGMSTPSSDPPARIWALKDLVGVYSRRSQISKLFRTLIEIARLENELDDRPIYKNRTAIFILFLALTFLLTGYLFIQAVGYIFGTCFHFISLVFSLKLPMLDIILLSLTGCATWATFATLRRSRARWKMFLLWLGLVVVIETAKWVVEQNTAFGFAIWILQFYWMAPVLMYEGFG